MRQWRHRKAGRSWQQHGLATKRQLDRHLNLGMLTLSLVLLIMQCVSCGGTALPEVSGDFGDAAQVGYGRMTGKLHRAPALLSMRSCKRNATLLSALHYLRE